ncbi:UNVERIFIED_CONTAM: hypothetical protein Sradi_5750200 [Sesamum radiatum]|uniref:Uncharacterized protein n=1 Tax=Sesamum radiatum TaxID=300843 RepID=A0AAW2L4I6_SESRA
MTLASSRTTTMPCPSLVMYSNIMVARLLGKLRSRLPRADSNTESEYIAASKAAKDAV